MVRCEPRTCATARWYRQRETKATARPPVSTGTRSPMIHGSRSSAGPGAAGTQNRHVCARGRSSADDERRPDDRDKDARTSCVPWRRITASVAAPMRNAAQLILPPTSDATCDAQIAKEPSPSIEKPNSLGSWLGQAQWKQSRSYNRRIGFDRSSVMKPKTGQSSRCADDARDNGHHAAASITACIGSPAESGSTTARMSAARDEFGPSTRMRPGPNRA